MSLMKSSRAAKKYGIPHSRVKKVIKEQGMTFTKVKADNGKYDYLFKQADFETQLMLWLNKAGNGPKKLSEDDKEIRRDNLKAARKALAEKRKAEKQAKEARSKGGKKKGSSAQATA